MKSRGNSGKNVKVIQKIHSPLSPVVRDNEASYTPHMQQPKDLLKILAIPVIGASLCCLSPLIIVMFGLGSVAFASSLADTLYLGYKWYFRLGGFVLLAISLVLYFRRHGICTLDQAKRRQKEILNTILITLFGGIVSYIVFLYVVVHYAGVFFRIWS